MKELLKLLNDFGHMHGDALPKQQGDIVFDEIYDIVNDYAAEQTFKETIIKQSLRHFEIGGLDWYAQIDFHEGQPWGLEQEPISDEWEIGSIYTSNMEKVDMESDLWQFLADEIENFHL